MNIHNNSSTSWSDIQPSSLLSPGEAVSGVTSPVLSPPVQDPLNIVDLLGNLQKPLVLVLGTMH